MEKEKQWIFDLFPCTSYQSICNLHQCLPYLTSRSLSLSHSDISVHIIIILLNFDLVYSASWQIEHVNFSLHDFIWKYDMAFN